MRPRSDKTDTDADYIIVGAGSAGCVVANRLSSDKTNRVTLLEAGGSERKLWIQIPIGYGKTYYDDSVNWKYNTLPDEGLNGRSSYWPRGKVLGGSSSINAMVYIRGQGRDFDDWAARGNPGWGAKDVFPVFEHFEDRPGSTGKGSTGKGSTGKGSTGKGSTGKGSGELHIFDTKDDIHPLCDIWLKAGVEAGYNLTSDFNQQFEGIGRYDITTKNGRRHSTARAFLRPALKRANLQLRTHVHVTRILFEGTKAIGVEYRQDGTTRHLKASKEIILCGGAINTPQLLQLSGIGSADLLSPMGIPVISDNNAVGQNLQDHIGINYYYKSKVPTLNDQLTPLLGKLKVGLQYVFTRRGILSLSVNQCGGFVKSNTQTAHPNMQLYFNPISYTRAPEGSRPLMHPDKYSAFLLSFQPCRPTSRGYLNITTPEPLEHPAIQPNYLSTNEDIAEVLEGCRLMRTFARTPSLRSVIEDELIPGRDVHSDEALLEDFKNRGDTVFHPVGTCIMGPDASDSVVDSELRVHGIGGLRVIDASIFPNLTSGNTNAPTIMVAEKGSGIILDRSSR